MQESEDGQSSVPSDLYDYLEKMDRDEEEREEEVRETAGVVSNSLCLLAGWQAKTWSFEINQEYLETLQRRYTERE